MAFKNMIFDLGGVLYDISPERSVRAFSELLGGGQEEKVRRAAEETAAWKLHEQGLIGDGEFRDLVRESLGLSCSDAEVDAAWNALLLQPREGVLDLLKRLKPDHRLVLLSNTNAIHFRQLQPGAQPILDCFERLFLSYEMGCRKPDAEIYEKVLAEMGWKAEDCLFIDDSFLNKIGAESVGISAICVDSPGQVGLFSYFEEYFSTDL